MVNFGKYLMALTLLKIFGMNNRTMKKLLIIICAVFILGACQSNKKSTSEPTLSSVVASDKQWTGVAVSQSGRVFVNYPFWSSNVPVSVAEIKKSVQEAAAERAKAVKEEQAAAKKKVIKKKVVRKTGATPNAITSASESSSTPNLLVVPVIRATLPSSPSRIADNRINQAARSKLPSVEAMMT